MTAGRAAACGLLRSHIAGHRGALAAVVVVQLVMAFLALYLPALNADIIDRGVVRGDLGHILRTGGWMVAVTVLHLACSILVVHLATRVSTVLARDLRASVFHRVLAAPARDLRGLGTATLLTRTTNDVQQIQVLSLAAVTMLVPVPVMGIGGVVMALRVDVPLTAVLFVSLPAIALYAAFFVRRVVPLSGRFQERLDTIGRMLGEQIEGSRVIRAFGRQEHERRGFDRANAALLDDALAIGRVMDLMLPATMLVANLSGVAVYWFGGHRVDDGGMTVGALTAFAFYLAQVLSSVTRAAMVATMVPRGMACAVRIQEVLGSGPGGAGSPVAMAAGEPPRQGHLRLDGAGFRYPDMPEPVLTGVSLEIPAGRTTAVIGATGSGKSTLLGLLAGRLEATEGVIRIDGTDLRALPPGLLPRTVSLMEQRPRLFRGTVATNLRYGAPEATDAELWEVLEAARARGFVERMPGGLDAPVLPGGGNLSGGQRQRIAIARTLLAAPRVHLFDDPFSALDQATAARLRPALLRPAGHATVVIVAERAGMIRDADRIVILDGGRVAGQGTDDELRRTSAVYREILDSQAAL